MRATTSRIIFIGFAYWLTGLAALQLAVPPGYTAPAFPPAGIALSALVIFGLRVWPAVYVGATLVQLSAAWPLIGVPGWNPLGPMLVPLGATLQAIAGAMLTRRLIGAHNTLDTPRAVLRFLAVAAPVSSLINPTIAVPALVWAGIVSEAEFALNWCTWWAGDTLGVLIAAPLMFVFFGQPAAEWRSRRLGVALPLLVALLLIGVTFRQVLQWDDMREKAQFARDADHMGSALSKRLEIQLDMMRALERFLAVTPAVSREQFRSFVAPWIERYPGTQSFGWSPLVQHARRADFETQVRSGGAEDFRILDRDRNGRTFPAAEAIEYLPIVYIEPFAGNASALGLNPLSLPAAASALQRARASERPAATDALRLVQESSGQQGVVIYLGVRDAESNLRGIISATLRMDDLLTAALAHETPEGLEVCLADRDAADHIVRLAGTAGCEAQEWLARGLIHRTAISFAGRDWELRSRAGRAYLESLRSWAAWMTIAASLLATGMLGALLLITTGSKRRIVALVDQRTTELEAASRRLHEQQEALAEAQRLARLGSWETVEGRNGFRATTELQRLLDRDDAQLGSLADLTLAVAPSSRSALAQTLETLAEAPGRLVLDCELDALPRRILHFRMESQWQDGQLVSIRGTAQDVTAAREAEAQIQYLAHYDTLTGLPNRSAWQEQARRALQQAQRHGDILAVLFLDLDNFKTVNDSLGHPAGDRLLAAIAQRLSRCMRTEDLLARIGGDEFAALLPRLTHPEDAAVVAGKILRVLSEPVHIDSHDLHLSVSIGIALYPQDGEEVDTLLKHADTAMYVAKESGRNNFQFFVPAMTAQATERLVMENDMRRAIERKEMILHYQPQIEAGSCLPYGCEALVRWIHPERGLIRPDQFIPLAESTGLIIPLGEWVLREACAQQVRWREAGLAPLIVAVNISALQFRKADFVATVANILRETGADPANIELEITESALMQPGEDLSARLQSLVDLGLTLALDDFGTGYSSLAYLKRLPIARLKIDRSFVADLPGSAEDAAVTSAALALARDLDMQVVAEGVETHDQQAYLTDRGCHAMQGYLFSRPLTADALQAWLADFTVEVA
ncbi:MAG: EAL domain-containing protein [Thauera sp.]|nr:EAL domain-containing protein [Thauera sp.]